MSTLIVLQTLALCIIAVASAAIAGAVIFRRG